MRRVLSSVVSHGRSRSPERQAQQRDEAERLGAGPAVVAEHAGEPQIGRGLEAGDRRLVPEAAAAGSRRRCAEGERGDAVGDEGAQRL